jgi:hypothetical protein
MAIRTIDILKSYFKKALYPTENQFSDLIDSFRHKNNTIPISDIEGLSSVLNSKAPISGLAELDAAKVSYSKTDYENVELALNYLFTRLLTISGSSDFTISPESVATRSAIKSFVDTEINKLKGSAPELMNALDELATALGNDPNFATTIMNLLATKVTSVTGKSLIADTEITRLAGVNNYDDANCVKKTAVKTINNQSILGTGNLDLTAKAEIRNATLYHGYWSSEPTPDGFYRFLVGDDDVESTDWIDVVFANTDVLAISAAQIQAYVFTIDGGFIIEAINRPTTNLSIMYKITKTI